MITSVFRAAINIYDVAKSTAVIIVIVCAQYAFEEFLIIIKQMFSCFAARVRDNNHEPLTNSSTEKATPFSYGSGHVRPNRAMNPGLVYDLTTNDYLNFLCALGYNSTQIKTFSNEPYVCPSKPIGIQDLNYPSITVPRLSGSASVTRAVRNVGAPGTYVARVVAPKGITVEVTPSRLEFSKVGEEKKFEVSMKAKASGSSDYVFGALIWSDGIHYVRSPIVVNSRGF